MDPQQEFAIRPAPVKLLVGCREGRTARALCTSILRADGRIEGDSAHLEQLADRVAVSPPDVLLLEYLPHAEASTWAAMSEVSQLDGGTRIVLLCEPCPRLPVLSFIQHGASGCLLSSCDAGLCAKAVVAVHGGEPWFGRTALLQAVRSHALPDPASAPGDPGDQSLLTAREREILSLIGGALSNKEIARALRISDKTVKTHLHHIYVKLHQSGRYKAFVSSPVPAPALRASNLGNGRRHGAEG